MYAVIEANGRPITVREGERIRLDRVAGRKDEQVVFKRVFLAHDGQDLITAQGRLSGATVEARIVRQGKGRKITVFHYKPKKRIRTRTGHRQPVTELRIEKIVLP